MANTPLKSNQDPKKSQDPEKLKKLANVAIALKTKSPGNITDVRLPIGYPPVDLYFSKEALNGSIPIMYLIPGQGKFVAGLDVFQFDPKLDVFSKMLFDEYQIRLNSLNRTIPISFIPEAIPGIQLSNDYGASILLEGMQQLGSPLLGQIGQMVGTTNIAEFISKTPGEIGAVFGAKGERVGAAISGIGEMLGDLAKKGAEWGAGKGLPPESRTAAGNFARTAAQTVGAMMMGSRIDFPKVWMGSGFSGPVSIPVRLYNPDQTSDVCYNKYIIEPLAILLNLGAPLSNLDNIYRWPYIHKIWSPGIFYWKMASLVGLTVLLGSDNQMSWNNRPSMIDVRLEFQPLHSVMLGRRKSNTVPAVGDYIDQLKGKETAPHLWAVPAGAPNVAKWKSGPSDDDTSFEVPGTPTPTVDPSVYQNPGPRVPAVDEFDYTSLQNKQAASGNNLSEDRANAEAIAAANVRSRADKISVAAQTQQAQDAALQSEDQKAIQDRQLQNQLESADTEFGGTPVNQAVQMAQRSPGPSEAELLEQGMAGNMMDDIAYTQSKDGAPPGESTNVTKEIPEGGKAPGQSFSYYSGVSSKLTPEGTSIVAAGSTVATSVIDGASAKAAEISSALQKATGMDKDLGQGIKTTVSQPTTVEDTRKANTFPTTSEEADKAQTATPEESSVANLSAYRSDVARITHSQLEYDIVSGEAKNRFKQKLDQGTIDEKEYNAAISSIDSRRNGHLKSNQNQIEYLKGQYGITH